MEINKFSFSYMAYISIIYVTHLFSLIYNTNIKKNIHDLYQAGINREQFLHVLLYFFIYQYDIIFLRQ